MSSWVDAQLASFVWPMKKKVLAVRFADRRSVIRALGIAEAAEGAAAIQAAKAAGLVYSPPAGPAPSVKLTIALDLKVATLTLDSAPKVRAVAVSKALKSLGRARFDLDASLSLA